MSEITRAASLVKSTEAAHTNLSDAIAALEEGATVDEFTAGLINTALEQIIKNAKKVQQLLNTKTL